jgi:hypothetical protein
VLGKQVAEGMGIRILIDGWRAQLDSSEAVGRDVGDGLLCHCRSM